ncbi:MAG: hypothetical protein R2733_26145 [Acidimicrobiales bacterium]
MAAVPAFSLVVGVGSAAAQPIFQPTFSDSQLCVTVDLDNALLQGPIEYSPSHAVDLPAGEIVIPEAISWDEYPNRELTPTQVSERWELEFLNADGEVIATSDAVPDVADGVRRAEYIGALGSVTLPEPAAAVRAHHRTDLPFDPTPASVHASGVTLCWEEGLTPPVCTDANGDAIDANADGTCPTEPAVCVDANGDPLTNADGTNVVEDANGDCPAAPQCVGADGTATEPQADGSCPPSGPVLPQCLGSDGTAVTPNADGTCPEPEPAGPVVTPSQPSPAPAQPQGGQLPVTGNESMILLLSGLWLLAAGTTATMFVRTR